MTELERLREALDPPVATSMKEAIQLDLRRSMALEACGDALLVVAEASDRRRADQDEVNAVDALCAVIREHLPERNSG